MLLDEVADVLFPNDVVRMLGFSEVPEPAAPHVLVEIAHLALAGQELETVAPYAVRKINDKLYPKGPKTDIATVNDQALIFVLVNAVMELQAKLEDVKRARDLSHG